MSTPDLAAIERRIQDCQTYNFGMRNADTLAHVDAPALLALVREQQAKLDAVRGLADRWATLADGDRYYARHILAALEAGE